jgi:hypothetical protein
MEACHGKSVRKNWNSGRRIHGWGVISRITTHLRTCSWKDEANIGSIRRDITTSHSEIWLRDMTLIKRICKQRIHHAPKSKTKIHIGKRERMERVKECLAYQEEND